MFWVLTDSYSLCEHRNPETRPSNLHELNIAISKMVAVLVAAVLAQVPVQTYLRYYVPFVLGYVDDTLDLIRPTGGRA